MGKRDIPPTEEVRDGSGGDKETIRKHPAFGMIGAARVQSMGTWLFGSPIKHRGFIILRIQEAEEHHRLNSDWHYANKLTTEVWLSEAQWASFVSTLNIGSGVPCTISYRQTGPAEDIPGIRDHDWRAKVDASIKKDRGA
jgi:hypothetical protein